MPSRLFLYDACSCASYLLRLTTHRMFADVWRDYGVVFDALLAGVDAVAASPTAALTGRSGLVSRAT